MLISSSHFCYSYIPMRTSRKISPKIGGRRHFSCFLTLTESGWCFIIKNDITHCFWGKHSLLHLEITILFLDLKFALFVFFHQDWMPKFVKMILGHLLNWSFNFSSSIIRCEKCICTIHIIKPFIRVSDSPRTWLVLHLVHVGFTSFICASFVYVPG